MIRQICWAAAALAMAMPPSAQAQSLAPKEEGAFWLSACAVARNAGDVRWLAALKNSNMGFDEKKRATLGQLAIASSFMNCPRSSFSDVDLVLAVRLAADYIDFHPNSLNYVRETDQLADCITNRSRNAAQRYVDAVEERVSAAGGRVAASQEESKKAIDAVLNAAPACDSKAAEQHNLTQYLALYSRMNWLLRAKELLDEFKTSHQASSVGVN